MPSLRYPADRPHHSPFAIYLRDINVTALLTRDEERELAERIEEGDGEARNQMVQANLRLVVNIARHYTGRGLNLEDLISEGNLGLVRAVEAFDPSHNIRFCTYATYWIKQSIKRALINMAPTVRLPAYMVDLLNKWKRATSQLTEELGRAPTQEEVAGRLGLSPKKMSIIRRAIRIAASSQQPEDSSEGQTLDELLSDEHGGAPDLRLGEADDVRQVLRLLDSMDERDAAILRLRFGLAGEDPLTLQEVGDRLGLTRERVRQLERKALAGLRQALDGEAD